MKEITLTLLPSEKAAERRRRERLPGAAKSVVIAEEALSLQHFVNRMAATDRPVIRPGAQKHWIMALLRKTPLRYFEGMKRKPFLAAPFADAIRRLKRACLTPEALKERLERAGTLKEYDLLQIYTAYEARKRESGVLDAEDLYPDPFVVRQAHRERWLAGFNKIVFENFAELSPAAEKLIASLRRGAPGLEIEIRPLRRPSPEILENVVPFSLGSPHQEMRWFMENFIIQGENPRKTGILMLSEGGYFETLWEKLKQIGLTAGDCPFLKRIRRPDGKRLLEQSTLLSLTPRPLAGWLEALRGKEESPFEKEWRPVFFYEELESLGLLTHDHFLEWLREFLEGTPPLKIPESLEGLQWLRPDEGDLPELNCLWIPNLTQEGTTARPSLFFQERKDRALREWEPIVRAFPDSAGFFETTRKIFFHFLGEVAQGAWLTASVRNSLGKEQSPSPLLWSFPKAARSENAVPHLFVPEGQNPEAQLPLLRQKLLVETERVADRLRQAPYHADLRGLELEYPQKEDGYAFSPSQLESYAACPFRYYARRLLDIKPAKDFSPDIDHEDRGKLFHDAMEELLREQAPLYARAIADPDAEKELMGQWEKIVAAVFRRFSEEEDYPNAELVAHYRDKTLEFGRTLLQKELSDARELPSPLLPFCFEQKFRLTAGERSRPIVVEGRLDRIDRDPKSGNFLVLDYKTGDTKPQKNRILEGLSLQLPLYILAAKTILKAGGEAVGGMLISVKKEGKRTHGMIRDRFNKIHFKQRKGIPALAGEEVFAEWMETVSRHIAEYAANIRAGYFSPQPKDCQAYCDYRMICRYAHKV